MLHKSGVVQCCIFHTVNICRHPLRSLYCLQIYPLIGQPAEELKKSKYANYFHGMFVSSRHASFCKDTLADCILKENALIAIESGKYIISLLRDEKEEFAMKEKEYAFGHGWSHYTSRK